jgi:hypothetical protein
MAHRMAFRGFALREHRTPSKTWSHIWNISHGVGTPGEERNHRHDVELVQQLLLLCKPIGGFGDADIPAEVFSALKPTGHLDHATTAAIKCLETGNELRHGRGWRISPARYGKSSYRKAKFGNWTYFICYLNGMAFGRRYEETQALPERCSAELRRALEVTR